MYIDKDHTHPHTKFLNITKSYYYPTTSLVYLLHWEAKRISLIGTNKQGEHHSLLVSIIHLIVSLKAHHSLVSMTYITHWQV